MIYFLLPEINKRVLAWVEDEEYPFVGYWNGHEWVMETAYLNCDTHRNDIFGNVDRWMDLPKKPTGAAMQKFHYGDLVRVAKNLGGHMRHFEADCDAIVMGSYSDKYGGDDTNSYTIYLETSGETSWYEEHQLTLIERNRIDILTGWKVKRAIKGKP